MTGAGKLLLPWFCLLALPHQEKRMSLNSIKLFFFWSRKIFWSSFKCTANLGEGTDSSSYSNIYPFTHWFKCVCLVPVVRWVMVRVLGCSEETRFMLVSCKSLAEEMEEQTGRCHGTG